MKRFLWLASLLMMAQVAAAVEGKGLPVWERSLPDTMYGTMRSVSGYADSAGLARILAMGSAMGPQVDSVAKTVGFEYELLKVRRDSAGLPVEVTTSTRAVGGTYRGLNIETFRYDGTGRKVAEIQTRSDTSEGWDTTRWVWTHEGCPDEYHSGERQVWSVDAQGRCSTAVVLRAEVAGNDTTWTDYGYRHSLTWDGKSMTQETESDRDGPYYVEQFSVVSDTLLTGGKRYESIGRGAPHLVSEVTYAYAGGRVSGCEFRIYDSTGAVRTTLVWSSMRSSGLGIARKTMPSGMVSARCQGNVLRFANTGSEAVEIEVFTVRGERVGALHVDSGREALLPVTTSAAMLVWSANGRTASARGTVLLGI